MNKKTCSVKGTLNLIVLIEWSAVEWDGVEWSGVKMSSNQFFSFFFFETKV